MQRTPNLGLPQFEPSDKYRLEDYNEAYAKIDEKIKEANDKGDNFNNFINNGGAINGNINVNAIEVKDIAYLSGDRENSLEIVNPQGGKKIKLITKDNLGNYINVTFDGDDGAFKPNTNGVSDLGTASNKFKNLHLSNAMTSLYSNSDLYNITKNGKQEFSINQEDGVFKIHAYNDGVWYSSPVKVEKNGNMYFGGHSLGQTGYAKLPNGMLLQWGMIEVRNQYEDMNIWYPVSFPEYCLGVWFESHMNVHNNKREWVKYGTWNNHNLDMFTFRMEGATNWVYPMWFALGY